MNLIMDVEELKEALPSMDRVKKLEILCKIGMFLRKEIQKDMDSVTDPAIADYNKNSIISKQSVQSYDEIFNLIKGK